MVNSELRTRQGNPELGPNNGPGNQAGFTIVEVIIAVVILAVGLLGMAGTTILVVQQTALSDMATDRSAALQTTIERLQALPYDNVVTGEDSVGAYAVAWRVGTGNRWKPVEIVTTGPGSGPGEGFPVLSGSVSDTFSYRIIRK